MNKIIYILLITFNLSFISTNAYAVLLAGAPSCSSWIKQKETASWESAADNTWLLGFISGYAQYSNTNVLKRINDLSSLYLWVNNYCRTNPLNKVNDAGDALFKELKKKNGLK